MTTSVSISDDGHVHFHHTAAGRGLSLCTYFTDKCKQLSLNTPPPISSLAFPGGYVSLLCLGMLELPWTDEGTKTQDCSWSVVLLVIVAFS